MYPDTIPLSVIEGEYNRVSSQIQVLDWCLLQLFQPIQSMDVVLGQIQMSDAWNLWYFLVNKSNQQQVNKLACI